MNNQLKEMPMGICVSIVGFNLIGLGVIANGGNYRGNPIWSFIQGFWQLQAFVLSVIIGGGILVIVLNIWMAKDAVVHVEESKSGPPMMKVRTTKPPRRKEKAVSVEPPVIIPEPVPPPPPPPTAAELKRKALRQITGKEF